MPFHGGTTEHSPVHGLQELEAALPKPQFPVKPSTPVISMTSALKEVGVVGAFPKRVNLMEKKPKPPNHPFEKKNF